MPARPARRVSESAGTSASARLDALRKTFRSRPTESGRAELFEALVGSAAESLARDGEAAATALAEAETLLPTRPTQAAWRGRLVALHRAKASLAQRYERHADAVREFEAALKHLPGDAGTAGRDANAARLQLLVRLARSRLALGQAKEVAAEAEACEAIMTALADEIPARALDTVRVAVIGNAGAALALAGKLAAAEAKFEAALGLIDRLAAPELDGLRGQLLQTWTGALRAKGRGADAEDVLVRFSAAAPHQHDAGCGCGHADPHHHHAHGAHHHGHGHTHDHGHPAGCGCGPHAH